MNQELSWDGIIRRQTQKWEDICYHLQHFEEHPLSLITDIFKGGDLFLAERLKQEGDATLKKAQVYWMNHLLPELTTYFDETEITLLYDEAIELSPIYIQYKDEIVAEFSPYWRQFISWGVPGKTELLSQRKELLNERERLEDLMDEMEAISKNPDLLAEDNTWGYAKAVLRPKKHQKKMVDAIKESSQELFEIQKKLESLNNQLSYVERNYVEVSYCLDKIKRKVARLGDFSFVELQEEEL